MKPESQTAHRIATALRHVATHAGAQQQLFLISNDCLSGQAGSHWVSIVCSMEWTEDAQV